MSQHASAHAARSHKLRNTLFVIAALLILLVIAGGVVGLNFYKQAKEVKAHEEQAVSSLSAITDVNTLKDAQASDAAIKQARTHTAAARDIANGTPWNMLSKMPVVGGDVTNVQGMTQVVDDLVQQTLPSLTDVVQQLANAQISGENGQLNLQPIVDAQDDFSSVSKQVKSLNSKLSNLPEPRIGMVKKAYSQSRSQFTKVTDMVEQVNNALQMLPPSWDRTVPERICWWRRPLPNNVPAADWWAPWVRCRPIMDKFRSVSSITMETSLTAVMAMLRNMPCSRSPWDSPSIFAIRSRCQTSPAMRK